MLVHGQWSFHGHEDGGLLRVSFWCRWRRVVGRRHYIFRVHVRTHSVPCGSGGLVVRVKSQATKWRRIGARASVTPPEHRFAPTFVCGDLG